MKLIIRDGFAQLNKDQTTHEFLSGSIDIISTDERTLFSIYLQEGGVIEVSASSVCKWEGKLLNSGIVIKPIATNSILISRTEYERE